ncbi:hypothetical protein [Cryptosporangium phraense]|uniref:Uncharacterized protein n=1 Tax=Cryptosporangium phraense TaxID=2593070 RepID=A0A545AEZ3_9ACTN|nr:hypothetical protein [Cryptosporangium phraense]TQS39883.1 hypothetical protein FL583_37710 [Cryptosporangium phraense]
MSGKSGIGVPGERPISLLLRVAAVCAVVVIAAITGITAVPGLPQAAPRAVIAATAHVVIVGVPGLRWDDVDAARTPNLDRLLAEGSAGSLSVRTAGPLTCPADGWVSLGAGNRARGPRHGESCPAEFPLDAPVTTRDTGARLPQQDAVIARNSELSQGARPGALADGVRCVTAVGRGAAVAAAHPSGRIDRYAAALPANPADLLTRCPVTVAEAPTIAADDDRTVEAAAVDAYVARVDAARPPGSVLLVVGVADTSAVPRLHVALAVGPGFRPGAELSSPTTSKAPFVQLMDVAPTAIAALGLPAVPSMSGVAVLSDGAQAADTTGEVSRLVDRDRAAGAQRPLVQPFFTIMVVAVILLLLVSWRVVFARWQTAVAAAGTIRPASTRFRWPRAIETVEVLAVALATVPVAAFAANVFAWWRSDHPLLTVIALIAAGVAGLTGLAYGGPWRGRPTGPIGCVAIGTALVLGADVLTGSNLQLNALPGYSPLVAGRFTGFGNLAFGVYAAGVLLGVGCLAQAVPGWRRPTLFTFAGAAAVVVVGAPGWGADVGGILALTPAVLLAAVRLSGRRVSGGVVAGAAVAALAVVTAFAAVDYARPEESRSHLGRFVAQLFDGSAGTVIQRKAEANVTLLLTSQLTILVVAVAVFVLFVLLVPTARLRRVLGLYPAVRSGLVGLLVAAVLGFALNDSGVAVPAFSAMVAVPLAIALTIRVAVAGQRTVRREPSRLAADRAFPFDPDHTDPPEPEPERAPESVSAAGASAGASRAGTASGASEAGAASGGVGTASGGAGADGGAGTASGGAAAGAASGGVGAGATEGGEGMESEDEPVRDEAAERTLSAAGSGRAVAPAPRRDAAPVGRVVR